MMKLSNLQKMLGALCLATVFSSCVAQEAYQDVETSAKHWQKSFFEADKARGVLARLPASRAREALLDLCARAIHRSS